MKLFKKLTVLMIPVLMILQLFPVSAHADNTFSYVLKADGTAEIFCLNPSIESAEIPAQIDGHSVTSLAERCFADCISLKSVTIPDTVRTFGAYAFYDCIAIEELSIPANVTEIGSYAFEATESMTKFIVDDQNPAFQSIDGVLYDKSARTLIKYPEAKPDTSYSLPDACQTVEDWAFIGAQYLEQINLNQVKSIGEDAFCWCVSLKEIDIPEGVEILDGAAFSYCEMLERVHLPSTIKALGDRCFYSCTSLKEINLPEGLQKLGAYTFGHCTSLTALAVPKSLTTVNMQCIGYVYNEDDDTYQLQDNFTLYVYKNSAAWNYAATNHIPYEYIQTGTIYYILIAVVCLIIIILIIAIIKVLKNRRTDS